MSKHFSLKSTKFRRGQSLLEVALLFPVLLIMLSGMVEFGLLMNEYLALLDAARNAARFSSDLIYTTADSNHNCDPDAGGVTTDFYRVTACVVLQEIAQERPNMVLDPDQHDDIIVSVFSIAQEGGVAARYPSAYGEAGWSYALDLPAHAARERSSNFSSSEVNARLDSGAPSTGLLLVEIFYSYDQKLKLPWITAFVSDPVILHVYSFMPLTSAEPR
jgi:hypothetical protein